MKLGKGVCEKCRAEIYVKQRSLRACELLVALTTSPNVSIEECKKKAKEIYGSMSPDFVVTDYGRNNGGLHKC